MIAPIEPNKEDCCNGGCNPCIFDVFEAKLKLYEKYKNENIITATNVNGISELEYTSFVVIEEFEICSAYKLIKFKRELHGPSVWWKPGDHFIVFYKFGDEKFSRAYSPIKLKEKHVNITDCDFYIIVKKHPNGVVSNFLFSLCKGDLSLWRGPYSSYEITPNKYKNIVLIAQGSGIVTLISIIDSILNNEDDMSKITLHYCCKSIDTILFRENLYNFKSYWNFTYMIYLSKFVDSINGKYEEPIINRKLQVEDINMLTSQLNSQFLVCGSDSFMTYYKNNLLSQYVPLENIIIF